MKSQTKNSKNHTNGVRKSQNAKTGTAPGSTNRPQSKQARASERAPVALGNKTFQSKPRYRNMGENLSVSHSEYIGDITGSTSAFAVAQTVALNPGLAASFPWLNQIASRYESYRFLKLNFRFMTERPTTESGYVAIVPDYDPTDPVPGSKSNAFQYESTAKCAPWENLQQHNLPRNLSKRKTYAVRQGVLSATENISLYDTGNIFICVGGNSGAVNLGELWCDYEVVLETPQIDSNVSNGFDSMRLIGATAQTAALPFGSGGAVTSSRNTIATYSGVSGALTFLVPFQGIVTLYFVGTTLVTASTAGSTATITAKNAALNAAATSLLYTLIVDAQVGQTLDVSVTAATVTTADLSMGPYSYILG